MYGDFGKDFLLIVVFSFLMVFNTDVFDFSTATVGILFMIAGLRDVI